MYYFPMKWETDEMPSMLPDMQLMKMHRPLRGYWISSPTRTDSALGFLCFCGADSRIMSSALLQRLRKSAPLRPAFLPLSLPDGDCDKVTSALLKSRTGEFDLESILFLKLRGQGKDSLASQSSVAACGIINDTTRRDTRPWLHRGMHEPGKTGSDWE